MNVAEYIAKFLNKVGCTDAFGIPGGVILPLLYAFDQNPNITPHLLYHEQAAGFAANGYAQASGKLGIAYATKGPGFTNLLTPLADAYFDSIPVFYITAHSAQLSENNGRCRPDQELDTCSIVDDFCKYSTRIDNLSDVKRELSKAYAHALSDRKGPVLLDFDSKLLSKEIESDLYLDLQHFEKELSYQETDSNIVDKAVEEIINSLQIASRPVLLIGDGINQCSACDTFNRFIEKSNIPVLSSRYSSNIVSDSNRYFGYVGSHGIRYANYIISEADLIIVLGNSLKFPDHSASYAPIFDTAKIIQVDIDPDSLENHPKLSYKFKASLTNVLDGLLKRMVDSFDYPQWIERCNIIRKELYDKDMSFSCNAIRCILNKLNKDFIVIGDVGNNEFYLSRAAVHSQFNNPIYCSKSFGALGNSLGKAIGAYYATKHPIAVFCGDQGIQLNIQELNYISQHSLPIAVIVMNNRRSAMISDREKICKYPYELHTTPPSGFRPLNLKLVANAFDIEFTDRPDCVNFDSLVRPIIIQIDGYDNSVLSPWLPSGMPLTEQQP